MSYEVASKRVQTDHIEDTPKLTNDAYKTIIDADNTRTAPAWKSVAMKIGCRTMETLCGLRKRL